MTRGIHWFRNDLRWHDNLALAALLERTDEWLPVFIFDPRVSSPDRTGAARMSFLLDCLRRLQSHLGTKGVPLLIRTGTPEEVLPELMHETGSKLLSFNEDTTPFASARDLRVQQAVEKNGAQVVSCVDHVVFDASEVRTKQGGAFSVFTPYRNAWWNRWRESPRRPTRMPRTKPPIKGFQSTEVGADDLHGIDTSSLGLPTGGERAAKRRLSQFLDGPVRDYRDGRDRPDRDGTSCLSPYLRFGALSIRECFERGAEAAAFSPESRDGIEKWLDQLIWRDFYAATLETHPRNICENHRTQYGALDWNDDETSFEAWCEGRTGFPIVDAGMKQLRQTGWMHNRVRMITASFLTKDLFIDWRKGERFFFDRLVDGDPASNNGGWQWIASTGADSQPYFRVFNPYSQGKRCDPDGAYVRRWVPELRSVPGRAVHAPWRGAIPSGYHAPIVDHAERRAACIESFRRVRRAEEPQ